MSGNWAAWLEQNADRLDYPDAGDPFRNDIQVDAPASAIASLREVLGILPGSRYYRLGGQLYRVHQDGTFALYGSGEWLPIKGATLRTERASEITPDAALAAIKASKSPNLKV